MPRSLFQGSTPSDGKTSRRARGKVRLGLAPASRAGQEAVDKRSNEIVAILLLLERLELSGGLVTIAAMGCQREIAERVRAKGADYLLTLNQTSSPDDAQSRRRP